MTVVQLHTSKPFGKTTYLSRCSSFILGMMCKLHKLIFIFHPGAAEFMQRLRLLIVGCLNHYVNQLPPMQDACRKHSSASNNSGMETRWKEIKAINGCTLLEGSTQSLLSTPQSAPMNHLDVHRV